MSLHSGLATPCISYMELNNYNTAIGITLGYSNVSFQVKIWGKDIATIQDYACQVDDVMRELGFKRSSSGELYDNESIMIQKILTYEGLAFEKY